MLELLLLMAMSQLASAGVITAPDATITPAPLVKRVVTTAGYRSTGFSDGTTLCKFCAPKGNAPTNNFKGER
jgi:hypothetical protein